MSVRAFSHVQQLQQVASMCQTLFSVFSHQELREVQSQDPVLSRVCSFVA